MGKPDCMLKHPDTQDYLPHALYINVHAYFNISSSYFLMNLVDKYNMMIDIQYIMYVKY